MTVRFSLTMSEELDREIDRAAEETSTDRSEIVRKALQLFIEARRWQKQGLKLGLVEPESEKMRVEIVGL